MEAENKEEKTEVMETEEQNGESTPAATPVRKTRRATPKKVVKKVVKKTPAKKSASSATSTEEDNKTEEKTEDEDVEEEGEKVEEETKEEEMEVTEEKEDKPAKEDPPATTPGKVATPAAGKAAMPASKAKATAKATPPAKKAAPKKVTRKAVTAAAAGKTESKEGQTSDKESVKEDVKEASPKEAEDDKASTDNKEEDEKTDEDKGDDVKNEDKEEKAGTEGKTDDKEKNTGDSKGKTSETKDESKKNDGNDDDDDVIIIDDDVADKTDKNKPAEAKWVDIIERERDSKLHAELSKIDKLISANQKGREIMDLARTHRIHMYPIYPEDLADPYIIDVMKMCTQTSFRFCCSKDTSGEQAFSGLLELSFIKRKDAEEHKEKLLKLRDGIKLIFGAQRMQVDDFTNDWKELVGLPGNADENNKLTLFAPSLPESVTTDELWKLFTKAREIWLVPEKPRQHAYIKFANEESLKDTIKDLQAQGPPRKEFNFCRLVRFYDVQKVIKSHTGSYRSHRDPPSRRSDLSSNRRDRDRESDRDRKRNQDRKSESESKSAASSQSKTAAAKKDTKTTTEKKDAEKKDKAPEEAKKKEEEKTPTAASAESKTTTESKSSSEKPKESPQEKPKESPQTPAESSKTDSGKKPAVSKAASDSDASKTPATEKTPSSDKGSTTKAKSTTSSTSSSDKATSKTKATKSSSVTSEKKNSSSAEKSKPAARKNSEKGKEIRKDSPKARDRKRLSRSSSRDRGRDRGRNDRPRIRDDRKRAVSPLRGVTRAVRKPGDRQSRWEPQARRGRDERVGSILGEPPSGVPSLLGPPLVSNSLEASLNQLTQFPGQQMMQQNLPMPPPPPMSQQSPMGMGQQQPRVQEKMDVLDSLLSTLGQMSQQRGGNLPIDKIAQALTGPGRYDDLPPRRDIDSRPMRPEMDLGGGDIRRDIDNRAPFMGRADERRARSPLKRGLTPSPPRDMEMKRRRDDPRGPLVNPRDVRDRAAPLGANAPRDNREPANMGGYGARPSVANIIQDFKSNAPRNLPKEAPNPGRRDDYGGPGFGRRAPSPTPGPSRQYNPAQPTNMDSYAQQSRLQQRAQDYAQMKAEAKGDIARMENEYARLMDQLGQNQARAAANYGRSDFY